MKINGAWGLIVVFAALAPVVSCLTHSSGDQGKTYKIGDRGPAGGWIFYDQGNASGGWRYLEAAPTGQLPPKNRGSVLEEGDIRWHNGKHIETGARATGIGAGRENTRKIIEALGEGKYAAKICADYRGGGKGDWFLPSKDELNLMCMNLHHNNAGRFAFKAYWSSSEIDAGSAWFQYFNDCSQGRDDMGDTLLVRAVRAF